MRVVVGLLLLVEYSLAQSVTPFSVTQLSRQFNQTGTLKSESRFFFAVNRDGSIVSVDLDPSAGGTRQILDAVHGREILINPKSRSASMMPYQIPRQSPVACEQRFVIGFRDAAISVEKSAGRILGVAVERVSVDWPDGSGMDVYMAPSLGCEMLRTISRRNGQALETGVAQNLRVGDPDGDLFEIPAGYRLTNVTH
jgi:hypothetical protein